MQLHLIDVLFFMCFFAVVVGVSPCKGDREDYFLAGRSFIRPLIRLSIVAANISTEQLVGMSGQGAGTLVMLAVVVFTWIFR